MKQILLFSLVVINISAACSQDKPEIENLVTFTKLYGYVRYFYPGDEAAATDWDRMAVYGARRVADAENPQELKQRLEQLFLPIAPALKLYGPGEKARFDKTTITPPDTTGLKVIAWQHLGVGFGNKNNIYRSRRTNRPMVFRGQDQEFGTTAEVISAENYRGKSFVLSARMKVEKGPGTGHIWARVDTENGMGFFDNMADRPVASGQEWATYEIKGIIDSNADQLAFGTFLLGKGKLLADDVELRIRDDNQWKTIYNYGFGEKNAKKKVERLNTTKKNYHFSIDEHKSGSAANPVLSITYTSDDLERPEPTLLFDRYAHPGEYSGKVIGQGLSCVIPLALYGSDTSTYPAADIESLHELKNELAAIPKSSFNGENLYVRYGGLTIAWNIFQHFYPYFDVAHTDWEADLRNALKDAYSDETVYDFQKTLEKFTAHLKDGHISVRSPESFKAAFFPPVSWEWVEDQLVITDILNDSLQFSRGDIVTAINGKSPEAWFQNIHLYISAATKGWLDTKARIHSLRGENNSEIVITLNDANGATNTVQLQRKLSIQSYYEKLKTTDSLRMIGSDVYYLNLDMLSDKTVNDLLPHLKKARGIIVDLRGYPKSNPGFINHLLSEKDTSSMWMRVPQIIYPDQEQITGYRQTGWKMSPEKPHLDARIVFITDGSAISYAESYMSFIEHYKLATIVGQSTAGTNGNINPFTLPGQYRISWTGMKVVKHDGSRHHGIGITPDVYVEKTVSGIREGRDEFLEKAVAIINNPEPAEEERR